MSQIAKIDYGFSTGKLVIVSNRLPVSLSQKDGGEWEIKPSSGGLVTALAPVLRNSGGLWIGWPGVFGESNLDMLMDRGIEGAGYSLKAITLTEEDVNLYYLGFSNEVIWPLFHDLQSRCNFNLSYWQAYQRVNNKFAEAILSNSVEDDYVWVQDYHLMLVAKALHVMGEDRKLGFFLHTPFPSPDIFIKLPWRLQILKAMLDYDLIGFQTMRDRNNFIHCAETLLKGLQSDTRRQISSISLQNHETKVGVFPISIDFNEFSHSAAEATIRDRASELSEAIPGCKIVLGVDRLDYSKGIPEKLQAFENVMERYENLHSRITLIQIVVPSRTDIAEYNNLKNEIEGLVSRINGKYAEAGWIPVNYMYRSVERSELLAYYRAAHIALVTPLKDGMNLVAKEYCASNTDNDGVLILSEFAGAAAQLHRNALMVNPYDTEGVANAIYRAYHITEEEKRSRMHRLRRSIARRDIYWWVDCFLHTAKNMVTSNPPEIRFSEDSQNGNSS
jgi:alpha,alpha-trehalose-phosphate synthase [UDP-forming]